MKAVPHSATRWAIPAAAAAFAVFLATSMASAKGKPQKRHAAPAATPAATHTARPRTTGPQHAAAPAPHAAPAGHATSRKRQSAHGHGPNWSAEDVFWHRERWGAQGSNVVEGALPPPVDGGMCPADMALVDGRYCVDRYEGSVVQLMADGSEQPWSPFETIPDGVRIRARSAPGVYPQAYISAAQAQNACAAAGKRLCNPTEWRNACGGPHHTVWPYGASHVANACNDHGRSPMLHFYPQVAESWTLVGMTEMNDERLNQWEGTLMRTGASPDCTNEYGVYDMVGNLHEWTSDPNGTFQGGWYLDTHINGDGCGYRTTAHEFTYHDYSTGFRCCADAVPANAAPSTLTSSTAPASSSSAPPAPSAEHAAPPANDTLAPQPAPTSRPHAPNPRHPEDDDPYSLQ